MRRSLLRILPLGLALAWLGAMGPSKAHAVLLSDLLVPGATIVNGDKVFSNFTYSITGDMPAANQVNVVPILDIFGNIGIRIQGGFTDLPGGGPSDATFGYDVTTNGSDITDVHLFGNPLVVGGPGQFIITESVQPLNPGPPPVTLGQLNIFDVVPNGPPKFSDVLLLPRGYRSLRITKDIFAFSQGGIPTISFIDQSFSQVPEPASVMLLGLGGVVALGVARRRFRKPTA